MQCENLPRKVSLKLVSSTIHRQSPDIARRNVADFEKVFTEATDTRFQPSTA